MTCRFSFPLSCSDKTIIVRKPDDYDYVLKEKKEIIVLHNISNRTDLSNVTVSEILSDCNVSEDEYYNALEYE